MARLSCSGWWEQDYFGRQTMHDLHLDFANGQLQGAGDDIVGAFTLRGRIEQDQVYLLKQYVGKHAIEYRGTSDGEGTYFGDWSYAGYSGGKWLIRIERPKQADWHSSTKLHV